LAIPVDRLTDRPASSRVATRPFDFRAWLEAWQEEFVFFRVDQAARIEYISPSVQAILNFEPAEIVGRGYHEFFDPTHPLCDQLRDLSNRMLAHDAPESKRCIARRRDGQYVFFLLRERDVFDEYGALLGKEVMAQEVTRRVEAELWLRQSERKYRRLVEGFRGDYIIYTRDAKGLLTYVSPSIESVLGYPREEVLGRNWRMLTGTPLAETADLLDRRTSEENGRQLLQVVLEVPRRDGEKRILEVQEWAIFGVDGRCLAMEGIAKDVTTAHRSETEVRHLKEDLERRVALRTDELSRINEELRASEKRYRNVVETQSEFIVRWTPDGRRTFVNEAYCRFLGLPAQELLGSNVMPDVHPDDRHLVGKFIANSAQDQSTAPGEARIIAADGSVRWTQWITRTEFDDAGRPTEFQSVGRDVTELKLAADLLRQKESHLTHLARLATMGEMVAGIAHELNQPLHAAKTFAEAARRHLDSGRDDATERAIECCKEISQAIVRTVEIIRRLREFTRASPVKLESLDLNEVVEGAVEIVSHVIRKTEAGLKLDLAANLPEVAGDRIQLEQVFVNLLQNACDALHDTPVSERQLGVRTFQCGPSVCLEITDTGCGVPAANASRVFDAFFTTKSDGMGMGLSLCKSIAEAHQMHIEFCPNGNDRGTTFRVSIPPRTAQLT
jgi:PAS domain S-box-containing protein